METDSRWEHEQAEAAASEAAHIGGEAGDESLEPAERAVREAGGGEAEGFEEAERELIEHASHGDSRSATAALRDRGAWEDPEAADQEYGEADHEHSSELGESPREQETNG